MVKPIEWNDSFSVGNALMDAHHQIFFRLINKFSRLVGKNDHDVLKECIPFLIEYITMHLSAEEELMLRANYPDFNNHKEIHNAFTQQVLYIEEAFNKDPASVDAYGVLKIMQDWLANHINSSDKRYMPYVQKLQINQACYKAVIGR